MPKPPVVADKKKQHDIRAATMNSENMILVVDDDPLVLSGTVRLLKQAGYTVIEARTGEQALQLAQTHIPDLILLDNVLPDSDGLKICRRLKTNIITSSIFISIISGKKIKSSDKSDGLEIGADEYITRPIENRELIARVKAMLRLRNAEKELERHRNRLKDLVEKRTEELQREITERKQVEKALKKRSQELAMLNKVSNQVSQSLSVDQVISKALEGMLQATEASAAFLLMKKGDELIPVGIAFSEPGRAFTEFPTHKLGECLCGKAVIERQPIYSTDINNDSRCTWEECKEAGLHSAAALPLFSGTDIIAVMGLGMDAVHDFEEQAEYLETLASAVALGLQNAYLYEQSQLHAQELQEKVRNRTRELEDSRMALIKSFKEVSEAVAAIQSEATAKGLTLSADYPESVHMQTDRRRLLQCVMNLLSNAVKYSKKGNIAVTARKKEQQVEICVADNGIGIAQSDLCMLFSSFVRLESNLKNITPGTGLGLYLTKKIIAELLGGNISVESRLAEGSTFKLTVPVELAYSPGLHDPELSGPLCCQRPGRDRLGHSRKAGEKIPQKSKNRHSGERRNPVLTE